MVGDSGTSVDVLGRLWDELVDSPIDYGPVPFWFWNDDLEETELLRQLSDARQAGYGGVLIHPRIGLSARVGYLTDAYFRLIRRVVDACAALGLRVALYDEGSYPSGSACGQVAAADPAYAARALVSVRREIVGPWRGYWRPSAGRSLANRLLCVVLARTHGGSVDAAGARLLPVEAPGLVRLEVDAGTWLAMACFDVPSGGHIRGVLPEQEDGSALAPAAGDLLNPAAVATFIRLTHEAYASALGEHLGTTVVAMFTDEPNPLGRGHRSGVQPYSAGLERQLAARLGWDEQRTLTWLPALWNDYGAETNAFRRAYARVVQDRLVEVFYGAQAAWCADHGLALTGHPAASNDMASLAPFHWPGQDVVWRWVLPGNDTGLSGPHSVAPKAATSAARAAGRRRCVTELFGAFGWQLSLDEAKWLIDWHLARGVNLFMPHALFYSVRDGRAWESEPDLGSANVWERHFPELVRYMRRMSWLLTDGEHLCDVAIFGNGYDLPWQAARTLYQHQIDFLYLDERAVQDATVVDGRLRVGQQAYRVVVVDSSKAVDGPLEVSAPSEARLAVLAAAGGTVLRWREGDPEETLVAAIGARLAADGDTGLRIQPAAPDLRVLRLRRAGAEILAMFNEGEAKITGTLTVPGVALAWWDPLRGTHSLPQFVPESSEEQGAGRRSNRPVAMAGTSRVRLTLQRRESRLLLVGAETGTAEIPPPHALGSFRPDAIPEESERVVIPIDSWSVTDLENQPSPAPGLGDWSRVRALERFSGTLIYRASVSLPRAIGWLEIDLGDVGEAAVVAVNGSEIGSTMWRPYRLWSRGSPWQEGNNLLEVRVTNSAANYYDGALQPSGLMGAVRLRLWPEGPPEMRAETGRGMPR